MKNIGMPVFRPTADCIWNAFRNSGKRHIVLTGDRQVGKSTLLRAMFPEKVPGMTTFVRPRRAVYLEENLTGVTVQIGTYDESLPGRENKMRPRLEGFETLGISALERCCREPGFWATVDEIGYLESGYPDFLKAIVRLMEEKSVAMVLRKQETPFFREIWEREDVFKVDLDAPYGEMGMVIMASGLGRRFGGNKLMADFQGSPLICRALDATEGLFARRVVVTRHEAVADLCRERQIDVVMHHLPLRSDTVRLGVETLGIMDGYGFCPGDQPLLRRETVGALLLSAINQPQYIWRMACGESVGAPVIFPHWAREGLLNLPDGKGGGHIIRRYPERVRALQVAFPWELKDVDCAEDLEMLKDLKPGAFLK